MIPATLSTIQGEATGPPLTRTTMTGLPRGGHGLEKVELPAGQFERRPVEILAAGFVRVEPHGVFTQNHDGDIGRAGPFPGLFTGEPDPWSRAGRSSR